MSGNEHEYWGKLARTFHYDALLLVIRYLRKFGKPPSNNKSFSQDELAAMINEAGFSVEATELIGNDTKAVCLTGTKNVSYTQNVE